MRDERGNYLNLKEISANGPLWARGCPSCKFGIVSAPDLTGACSLTLERLVQATDKQLVFCKCKAGECAYNNMRNLHQQLIEEARKDPRMQEQAHRLTHPDIEGARHKIELAYATMPPPSMHYERASEQAEREMVMA